MIASGLVEVNGHTVTALGSKADPERDHIRVNGKLLRGAEQHVYLLVNKPKGYVTTVSDPEGRPTVINLLRGIHARVYPVGRLDYASEGLLLLTNDGGLAQSLMKAASHVPKVYLVKVAGMPEESGLQKLRRGLMIPEGRTHDVASRRVTYEEAESTRPPRHGKGKGKLPSSGTGEATEFISSSRGDSRKRERVRTAPAKIRLVRESENPWYEVTLIEGKNRQLRKMFEEIGHHVEKIKRVRYGPLTLDVPPGEFRRLTPDEVRKLKRSA